MERQRFALAHALLTDPCLLILDEHTSLMDHDGQRVVKDVEVNRISVHQRVTAVTIEVVTVVTTDGLLLRNWVLSRPPVT